MVYYEDTGEIEVAIAREKILKKLNRLEKIKLIESINPEWEYLSLEFETCIPAEYIDDDNAGASVFMSPSKNFSRLAEVFIIRLLPYMDQ